MKVLIGLFLENVSSQEATVDIEPPGKSKLYLFSVPLSLKKLVVRGS